MWACRRLVRQQVPTAGFRRRYAATDPSVEAALDGCDAFGQLLDAAGKVAAQHAEMAGGDVAAMFIALAQFAAAVYPGQLGLVDRVLVACHEVSKNLSVWLGLHLLAACRCFALGAGGTCSVCRYLLAVVYAARQSGLHLLGGAAIRSAGRNS